MSEEEWKEVEDEEIEDSEEDEYDYKPCRKNRFEIPKNRNCKGRSCLLCRIKNWKYHFLRKLRPKLGFCTNCWKRITKDYNRCEKHYKEYCEFNAEYWLDEYYENQQDDYPDYQYDENY